MFWLIVFVLCLIGAIRGIFWLRVVVAIFVISAIVALFQRIFAKVKISSQMKSNPESALRTIEKSFDSFTIDEYERQLIQVAERTGYVGAMLKLADFYSGDDKKRGRKNDAKRAYWKERAAKAGDLACIAAHYGFSDYDVSGDAYDEMLRDLDTAGAAADSENRKAAACYMKGIVCYKMGETDTAKELFASLSFPEWSDKSAYMLFRCFIKETNISAAEKVLRELETKDFEVPAADYLSLYNYYAAKRDGDEPDYAAEGKYAEKYAASKDADRETANRIGGSAFYSIAVSLQNGCGGFERNMEKSLEAYEKAAGFENAEALYYLGRNYWIGKEMRNYHTANEFLLKAGQKGHEQAQKILKLYGVDGVLVRPMQAEKISYQFLNGYELTASGNIVEWLQLYYGIQYKESLIASAFSEAYKKTFHSFDQLINGIHQLYADHVALMLKWSIQLLMFFGIDMYDAADMMDACEDLSLLPRVPGFERGLERIDTRAEQLNMQTAYAKATRGQWSGTGFGTTIGGAIGATVKASVAAGVMNVGSGILHGIGDSIVRAMDSSEIKGLGKQLFENPNTEKEFINAVINACIDITDVVIGIIGKHCGVTPDHLEGEILFGGENLAEIDGRTLNAKINNNLSAQNWDYVYALSVEKLRRAPLDADVFEQVVALTIRLNRSFAGREYESIVRYAGDFRLDTQNLRNALEAMASAG